jgi:hypothetical protein
MTMRMRFLVAVLLVAGCSPSAPPSGGKRQITSNGGGYTVTFEPTPDPIPMNEVFDLRFTVVPKSGSTQGLTVQVDARMPAHGHGMNRVPKLTAQPDGSTRAEGMLFHMPGHWELYFDIAQGGKTERAQVDVELK